MFKKIWCAALISFLAIGLYAQDTTDISKMLEAELKANEKSKTEYITATFKTTRLIDGHSVENAAPGVLDFKISHRFATETVSWEYQKDILEVIENLKKENVSVFAIEQVENSIFLQDFKVEKNKKYALIFGNEVYGVSQSAIELCDGTIEIPQLGTKHSLNISVSAGIVVWDLFQKMNY